jgi:hypothetical protein
MKIRFIILMHGVYSFFATAFAQTAEKKENDFGLSLAINSIQAQVAIPLVVGAGEIIVDADGNIVLKGDRNDHSISLSAVPKYYINKDVLLRFEFGITNLNLRSHYEVNDVTNSYHETDDDAVSTKIYHYAPGVQWIFMRKKVIESYCGMAASYINYKSLNYHSYHERTDFATGALQGSSDVTMITPAGFAAGAGAFAGFNIYLLKSISIGAELSSSALYYKLGGEVTLTTTEFNIVGPNPAVTYHSTYPNSYKGFKISKITSAFNISIWI